MSRELLSDLARERMATIQHWEQNDGQDVIPINPSVKRAAGQNIDLIQVSKDGSWEVIPFTNIRQAYNASTSMEGE
jgi:hypothetical protein